ncbi:hypothetical protein JCM11641_001694 [Rhodosporidiobolus odoratus]
MLRTAAQSTRYHSTATRTLSPHPALTLIPSFLTLPEQSLLLTRSLRLLDSPSRSTAAGRKLRKQWRKAHPHWNPQDGFMDDEAYAWEEGHFDGVIKQYREMLVGDGAWGEAGEEGELARVLKKVYSLLPAPSSSSPTSTPTNPPSHLIMHLLHLSSNGAIYPHVDNVEAFGRSIVGVSLGSERVMRFKQVSEPQEGTSKAGPSDFEVLVEPGSAYVQAEPLRTHYTHEVLGAAEWEGRKVEGSQRLSIMLRVCQTSVILRVDACPNPATGTDVSAWRPAKTHYESEKHT